MRLKRKVVVSAVLSFLLVTQGANAANISDKDKTVVTVNDKKLTEENLYDSLALNAGYTPGLEVLDYKVLSEKYKDDSRLQKILDEKYDEVKEANKEDDKDLKKEFASYGVSNKEDYIKKSGLLLAAYRELISIDTAYDTIFTKEEKDYIYKNKFSGQGKIYRILISPKISSIDANDESKINSAKADALKTAESVVSDLNKGTSFQDAVKKYSDDKVNDTGLIGDYNVDSAKKANVDQAIINAAFALENKKYTTTPIETQYGYEIVYIEYSKEKKSYDELKNDIAKILYDMYKGNNQYIGEYMLTTYRANDKLNIYDQTISKSYANVEIQNRKSYIQFDPEAANQYGNMGY